MIMSCKAKSLRFSLCPGSAHRIFYTLPEKPLLTVSESFLRTPSIREESSRSSDLISINNDYTNNAASSSALMSYIHNHTIGVNQLFRGPYGDRRVIYCDWTASGRSLSFIEDFIRSEVLPIYGNTHTTTSVNSLQTTMFRHEAREILRNAVRASADDAVIFVGSGCTGAIHKLIHNLNLEQPPIVIVGPFEHHSNMLPWRHLALRVLRTETDSSGTVSLKSLEALLQVESVAAQETGSKLIVCMTAASNVTGILVDVDEFTSLVHRYGGLAFWDYATAAPYVKIDMNPVTTGPNRDMVHKDAIYFSMHKFIGGPQTPGVLIAKRFLFEAGEVQPSGCGGGTVFFVRRNQHLYLKDVEEREEGGTPAIVESIRAGMAMQLKEAVTAESIMEREETLVKRIWEKLADCPNIIVLGGSEAPRLPIISVVIRHTYPVRQSKTFPSKEVRYPCLFLHHNFVASLLNDLFGIQARSGCACAGPYAMDLLGIDEALAKLYEEALIGCGLDTFRRGRTFEYPHREVIRPGFTRISLPYFMPDAEADFVLDALKFVATHGWAFLPQYSYNPATAEWVNRHHDPGRDRKWLGNIQYTENGMIWSSGRPKGVMPAPETFEDCLKAAHEELCKAVKQVAEAESPTVPDDTVYFDDNTKDLRWFLLPSEASAQIRNEINNLTVQPPNSSPWHPGSLSACFCPDLATPGRQLNDALLSSPSSSLRFDQPSETFVIRTKEDKLLVPSETQTSHLQVPHIKLSLYFNKLQHEDMVIKAKAVKPHKTRARSKSEPPFTSQRYISDTLQLRPYSSGIISESRLNSDLIWPNQVNLSEISCGSGCKLMAEKTLFRAMSDTFNVQQIPLNCNNNAIMRNIYSDSLIQIPCPLTMIEQALLIKSIKKQQNILYNKPKISINAKENLWCSPTKNIFKLVNQAIEDFNMIVPNDKVLVYVSGGKDSLTLLHSLKHYQMLQQYQHKNLTQNSENQSTFKLGVVVIDPETSTYNPSSLIPYLNALGIPYYYEKQSIMEQARSLPYEVSSICSFCSRLSRGRIYSCARKYGYNVIALGHHLDDVIERQKDLRVIRPLIYVRESQTQAFADLAKLPIVPRNSPCCFKPPKERYRMKRFLAEQELLYPWVFRNLLSAITPLISEQTTRAKQNCEKKR